jgi:hypothetical protein
VGGWRPPRATEPRPSGSSSRRRPPNRPDGQRQLPAMSRARPGAGMRSSFLASARLSPVAGADDGTAIPALSRRFATAKSRRSWQAPWSPQAQGQSSSASSWRRRPCTRWPQTLYRQQHRQRRERAALKGSSWFAWGSLRRYPVWMAATDAP